MTDLLVALGECQNHAVALIQAGLVPVPDGRDPINFLWELRDKIYRNVTKRPFQPEHYCYQHQAERIQNPKSSNWEHKLGDAIWCVSGVEYDFIFYARDPEGKPDAEQAQP